MNDIVEQVKVGLESKIDGIRSALNYVCDPREVERLKVELESAVAARAKLDKPDDRTSEELDNILKMVNVTAEVESPSNSWSKMSPIEKFTYHLNLYSGKLDEAYNDAHSQYERLSEVVVYLGKTDFIKNPSIEPIYTQFKNSLRELDFSVSSLRSQRAKRDKALKVVDEAFFNSLDILNQFMNNPMSLPHLSEDYDLKLGALKNAQKNG